MCLLMILLMQWERTSLAWNKNWRVVDDRLVDGNRMMRVKETSKREFR
jgi:hypothetical protein